MNTDCLMRQTTDGHHDRGKWMTAAVVTLVRHNRIRMTPDADNEDLSSSKHARQSVSRSMTPSTRGLADRQRRGPGPSCIIVAGL